MNIFIEEYYLHIKKLIKIWIILYLFEIIETKWYNFMC
jgi:hypothetical protein